MNIIHILGITILFSTSYSLENSKIEKALFRKLQSYQPESKPMWNEVLADVLVNKIRIFSFKKEDKQTESIKDTATEKSAITNLISQVFVIYKKFVYDVFVHSTTNNPIETPPEIEAGTNQMPNTDVMFSDGPKSEVELIEPRYHGKQVLDGTDSENSERACPEGTVVVDGHCVVNSKLMMTIPNQCPIGYKRDSLGYCRMMF